MFTLHLNLNFQITNSLDIFFVKYARIQYVNYAESAWGANKKSTMAYVYIHMICIANGVICLGLPMTKYGKHLS